MRKYLKYLKIRRGLWGCISVSGESGSEVVRLLTDLAKGVRRGLGLGHWLIQCWV